MLQHPLSIITCDGTFSMGLEMAGTIVYADTHTHSEAELNACPHIFLTSPHPWDPTNIHFNRNTHLMEEEVRRIFQKYSFNVGHQGHRRGCPTLTYA
eukprot:7466021-Ditylum_brightwellii.AAC.1